MRGRDFDGTPNRRNVLKGVASTAAIATGMLGISTAIVFGPALYNAYQEGPNREKLEKRVHDLREHLKKRYECICGTRITYEADVRHTERGIYVKEVVSLLAEERGLTTMRQVLAQYPPELLRGQINTITIVAALKHPTHGAARGIHMSDDHILINSSEAEADIFRGATIKEGVPHHEIGHANHNMGILSWRQWTGGDLSQYIGDEWKKLTERPPGFASRYGKKNRYEDFAEVWRCLFNDTRAFIRLCERDTVLKMKKDIVKNLFDLKCQVRGISTELLAEYWRIREQGRDVDEEFWDKPKSQKT